MEKINREGLLACMGGSAVSNLVKSLAISLINVIKAVIKVRSLY